MGEYDRIARAMAEQRPADPLRWLRDAIPENKDGGLSMLNIIRSALGTSANWLDGTKDPSRIGPEEMVAPLGLAGMGTGLANAMTRPGRDFRIADDLARQHPGASAVGDIPRFAPLRDASNPTSAAHVADYGSVPGARPPMNSNATPYAVMADNAKGSAPGTVVNSFAEGGRRGGPAIEEVWGTKFQTHMSKEYEKAVAGGDLSTQFDILSAKYANSLSDTPEIRAAMKAEMDRIEPEVRAQEAALREELRQRFGSPPKLLADNAKGSAPGSVINSLDMSEAARMQRAKEMGFDTDTTWYHGTGAKFDEFKPRSSAGGVYMTTNPAEASRYADIATRGGDDASVLPLLTRGSKIASTSDIDAAEAALMKSSGRGYVPTKEVYAELERRGFEGWRDGDIAVTFDPRNIRSTQAAFDPAKRDSANLLAASPSASAPGLAANSTQQQTPPIDAELKRRLLDALMMGSPDA